MREGINKGHFGFAIGEHGEIGIGIMHIPIFIDLTVIYIYLARLKESRDIKNIQSDY